MIMCGACPFVFPTHLLCSKYSGGETTTTMTCGPVTRDFRYTLGGCAGFGRNPFGFRPKDHPDKRYVNDQTREDIFVKRLTVNDVGRVDERGDLRHGRWRSCRLTRIQDGINVVASREITISRVIINNVNKRNSLGQLTISDG